MSEVKLEPCPFCGSDEAGTAKGRLYSYGQCGRCGATSSAQTTNEKAAKAWNTRTPHPSHAAVEAMAEALEEWPAFCAEAESHINGVITVAAVHGVTYDGPNWTDILNQTKATLAAYRATQTKDVRP